MTIPKWLLQFGSITGLLTFCFTIWDRLLSGRPSVTIRPTANGRDLFCHNLAQQDVVIKKIRCSSKGVIVAHNDSSRGVMNAAVGESFAAILSANTERGVSTDVQTRRIGRFRLSGSFPFRCHRELAQVALDVASPISGYSFHVCPYNTAVGRR
jgi:hypothetical protein